MYPPPYTTILLHTASTMSSGLTFLYQRQCPHHHIPLFYCAHCVLHTASTGLTFLHQRTMYQPPYTTILLRCIHCILSFDLFVSKTMSPLPYTTILLHPLHTASTPLSHFCVILPQPDIHYWYYKLIAHMVCLTNHFLH